MKQMIGGRRARRGMALLYTVFAVVAAATLVSTMLAMSMASDRTATTKRRNGRAQYLAEGAVEVAKREVASAIANWKVPPATGTVVIDATPVTYAIAPSGFDSIVTDAAGVQTIVTGYALEATASVEGHSFRAHRLINAESTPVFQFAVFYTDDLEINPGPSMTLGGRVRSNGDIYLNSGGTLKLNTNYLHATGGIYRNRKDAPAQSQGTVDVRNWVANPFNPAEPSSYFTMMSVSQLAALGVPSTSGYDSAFTGWDSNGDGDFDDPGDWYPWAPGALAYWSQTPSYANGQGHTVMSGVHGVTKASVPHIGSVQMYEPSPGGGYYYNSAAGQYQPAASGAGTHDKGFYHAAADLAVITHVLGGVMTIKAYDKAGNDVTSVVGPALKLTQLYDARQANGSTAQVKLAQIDLSALAASGKFPPNKLLYAAHYGAGTGTNAKAIQLVNGAQLAGKLTVVSEDPLYIKGDYNTVAKKGAAVIGDAVNLLSNAWSGTKTKGNLPSASNTTYNVAILTGNQSTVGSAYNGGLENLPRFHENWTGKTCTIKGSFVNLWPSTHATAAWAYGGDRYTAPNRAWGYDTAFNSVANLPPFTPMTVIARDVVSW